jgi:hypothetical protein
VSTRLRAASLSSLAGNSSQTGPTKSAGGYVFAAADSTDGAASATRDLGKASNTAINLATNSLTNRYGYGTANDAGNIVVSLSHTYDAPNPSNQTDSLAPRQVDSTQDGQVNMQGGRFASGYNFGAVTTTTSTYPNQMDD